MLRRPMTILRRASATCFIQANLEAILTKQVYTGGGQLIRKTLHIVSLDSSWTVIARKV